MLKQNFSWHTSVIALRINPKPITDMAKKIAEQLIAHLCRDWR
jgi:pyruvate dehydrogenase (quinone)